MSQKPALQLFASYCESVLPQKPIKAQVFLTLAASMRMTRACQSLVKALYESSISTLDLKFDAILGAQKLTTLYDPDKLSFWIVATTDLEQLKKSPQESAAKTPAEQTPVTTITAEQSQVTEKTVKPTVVIKPVKYEYSISKKEFPTVDSLMLSQIQSILDVIGKEKLDNIEKFEPAALLEMCGSSPADLEEASKFRNTLRSALMENREKIDSDTFGDLTVFLHLLSHAIVIIRSQTRKTDDEGPEHKS